MDMALNPASVEDQYTSILGQEGCALLMDERDRPDVAQASSLRGTGWKPAPTPRIEENERVLRRAAIIRGDYRHRARGLPGVGSGGGWGVV